MAIKCGSGPGVPGLVKPVRVDCADLRIATSNFSWKCSKCYAYWGFFPYKKPAATVFVCRLCSEASSPVYKWDMISNHGNDEKAAAGGNKKTG